MILWFRKIFHNTQLICDAKKRVMVGKLREAGEG